MSSEWMSIFISMEMTSCVTFCLCLFRLDILKTLCVVDFSVNARFRFVQFLHFKFVLNYKCNENN